MASSSSKAPIALFLALNLLMFCSVAKATCDPAGLNICVDVLKYLVNLRLGPQPVTQPCCDFIHGVLDVNAAACVCATLKTPNYLGLGGLLNALNIDIHFKALFNECNHLIPGGYVCGY